MGICEERPKRHQLAYSFTHPPCVVYPVRLGEPVAIGKQIYIKQQERKSINKNHYFVHSNVWQDITLSSVCDQKQLDGSLSDLEGRLKM